jgi:hypothetical protein
LCSKCPGYKGYTQRQAAWRHIRTAHSPNQCSFCKFKWGRRYEYRNHLKKKHPRVNPDVILREAPGAHYSATVLTKRLRPQPAVSPPAVEHDQQNCAESQLYPSAPPSPTGWRDTGVSRPAVSFVDCNPQPVYTEKTATIDEHEYTRHPAMLLSTEEPAGPMNGFPQDDQFGLEQSFSM